MVVCAGFTDERSAASAPAIGIAALKALPEKISLMILFALSIVLGVCACVVVADRQSAAAAMKVEYFIIVPLY